MKRVVKFHHILINNLLYYDILITNKLKKLAS
jgi:hypothetical protein